MTKSGNDDAFAYQAPPRGSRPVRVALGQQVFIKKGVARLDLQDPYYFAVSLAWHKFALLFLAAELAINVVFATLYSLQPGAIGNQGSSGLFGAFFFSLETLATVGYGEMYPATAYAHVVASVEILVGVIFTAIMTGLLFVRFSKPKAKVQYAVHPVVTRHNGQPTLMIRIGNARSSLMHDARASLYTLSRMTTDEGHAHVAVVEMPLVRSRIPVFAILYTLMHVIDEASPLHGLTAGHVEIEDMRFYLSFAARDPTMGQEVTDLHTFDGTDIRFGMRYVDAVKTYGRRKVVADYRLLSELVADDPAHRADPSRT